MMVEKGMLVISGFWFLNVQKAGASARNCCVVRGRCNTMQSKGRRTSPLSSFSYLSCLSEQLFQSLELGNLKQPTKDCEQSPGSYIR